MIISAFTIETETVGFARCWWPANSKKEAFAAALGLSQQAIGNPKYLSSFWVMAGKKPLAKFYQGKQYGPHDTI